MKQFLLTLLSALAVSSASAQLLYPAYTDSSNAMRIELDGIAEYGASAIYRDLTNTMLWGGYIDREMKDRSFENHKEVNRVGFNANSELRYIHGKGGIFGNDSLTWMVKAGAYAVGNFNYSKDMFGLVYYGNAEFPGQKLDFTGSGMDFSMFQKIGFGLVSRKNQSSVTLNLVNVSQYADYTMRKGSITTNGDGSQVDLEANGTFRSTSGNNFSKGIGIALDIDYRISTPWIANRTATIQLLAQNIGFAHINSGLVRYDADSSWTYSGFEFDSFRNGNNPLGSNFSLLDSLGIKHDTVKRSVWLPGYIQVMKMADPLSPLKVQSFFGIRFYPTFNSVPLLFAGAYWKAAKWFHASASVSYGNFTRLNAGIYATFLLKKFSLMAGTDNVPRLVSKNGSGESLVTRLIWKF